MAVYDQLFRYSRIQKIDDAIFKLLKTLTLAAFPKKLLAAIFFLFENWSPRAKLSLR